MGHACIAAIDVGIGVQGAGGRRYCSHGYFYLAVSQPLAEELMRLGASGIKDLPGAPWVLITYLYLYFSHNDSCTKGRGGSSNWARSTAAGRLAI